MKTIKTIEAACIAGHHDGAAGLGPIAPRNGPPGSAAHVLHDAYMQAYRDALVARVGVGVTVPRFRDRRKNPRRGKPRPKKTPPRRRAGQTVTTTTRASTRTVRRTNRRRAPRGARLYAHKRGKPRLAYLGRGKFGQRGRPMRFTSAAAARLAARILRDAHRGALRGWTLKAG